MFGFFDIFGNMVDEKRSLKRYMVKHHITFLKLRDLFLDLQKEYRELMIFKWQDMGIVYERNYEIRILRVKDWSVKQMVQDEESFRKIVDTFLKEGDVILNRNIPSSHYPNFFIL